MEVNGRLIRTGLCRENLVEFVQQFRKLFPKQLMCLAESAALDERRVIEIVRLDAQAGGDVVADQMQPGKLVRVEGN